MSTTMPNDEFQKLCNALKIEFLAVAANPHEKNGGIERADRTLHMTYNPLRMDDRLSNLDDLVLEGTYGKNLICGSKLGLALRLIYVVQSLISDDFDFLLPHPVSVAQQFTSRAHHRFNLMLGKQPHASGIQNLVPHPPVYFWRYWEGWLGPAKILNITEHNIVLSQNGHQKH